MHLTIRNSRLRRELENVDAISPVYDEINSEDGTPRQFGAPNQGKQFFATSAGYAVESRVRGTVHVHTVWNLTMTTLDSVRDSSNGGQSQSNTF